MAQAQVRRAGVSLILIIIAIVLCLLAAFGVDSKLGFSLFPLGVAAGFASFIF